VENLGIVLEQNQPKFSSGMPCLSRVKGTLEETLNFLSKLKKKGFIYHFFLAKSYKKDFCRLNSSLSESLSDLHFVVTATKPVQVDPNVIAEEIYQRLLNTLPQYVCATADRISELVDMPASEQSQLIDLVNERQPLEKQSVLDTLQQLKEQKEKSSSAFQRSAPQKLLSSFAIRAGPPMAPHLINPIDPNSRVGEGTFGNVFKGSSYNGVSIAVKYIQAQSQADKKMFEREIGSLRRLSECPFVVKYYGWMENIQEPNSTKSCVAIVLEFCPQSLINVVMDFDYEPPLTEWIRILHQIASGMRHLSQLGVIHRDLKPDNILITAKNEVAITDFGLSITKSSIQRMTASQKLALAGTIGYMAPDSAVSEFSDVYAFGVIMSFVLNRAEPWVDNRGSPLVGSYLREAVENRPPRLPTKDLFPECSDEFLDLCRRCCEKLPALRPRFVEVETVCRTEVFGGGGEKEQPKKLETKEKENHEKMKKMTVEESFAKVMIKEENSKRIIRSKKYLTKHQ
jgi:tRNA A-37 threonylcarbamoyl transferase component Bud32